MPTTDEQLILLNRKVEALATQVETLDARITGVIKTSIGPELLAIKQQLQILLTAKKNA